MGKHPVPVGFGSFHVNVFPHIFHFMGIIEITVSHYHVSITMQ